MNAGRGVRQYGMESIDFGRPLGMSGARITLNAARLLHGRNARYALVTMCIGVGQGYAVILEKA